MEDNECLEIVWAAINCEVEPIEIMRAIEKRTGRKALNTRWSHYFDADGSTEVEIRKDLNAMAHSSKRVQLTSMPSKSKIRPKRG